MYRERDFPLLLALIASLVNWLLGPVFWRPDARTHLDAEHIARFKITTVPTGRSVFRAFLARALGHAEFIGDHFDSGGHGRMMLA
jgi:hypothetical protein